MNQIVLLFLCIVWIPGGVYMLIKQLLKAGELNRRVKSITVDGPRAELLEQWRRSLSITSASIVFQLGLLMYLWWVLSQPLVGLCMRIVANT